MSTLKIQEITRWRNIYFLVFVNNPGYTAIANSQDDVILLGVGDDGKGGLAQEGVGRWTRYRLPECGTPHIRTVTPHI